jgi:GDP-4-dehydro-6-deoxy-D-mannose reductase
VTWRGVDVLDRAAVRDAIRQTPPTAVYHLAGAAHVGDAWHRTEATLSINVRGTHHLLDALWRERQSVRVLIPSSAMVYRPANEPLGEDAPLLPPNPYGVSKLATELLAARAMSDGGHVLLVRPFNHVGPRQDPSFVVSDFARQIVEVEQGRRDPEIVVGNLEARRELTDVRDTVRAYRMVMERGEAGRPYNVSSGTAWPIREMLDRLIARARISVRVRIDEARLRPNDVPLLVGNPRRIQTEIGWTPIIPLEQTLDDVLEYWRSKSEV